MTSCTKFKTPLLAALFAVLSAGPLTSASARASENAAYSNQGMLLTHDDVENGAYHGQDWQVSVGGGVMITPEYEGADEYDILPIPFFDIRYQDRAFLNPWRGLGYEVYKDENFTFGGALGWDFGRDEDDADHLDGLGDVDPGVDLKIFGEIDIGLVDLVLEGAQNVGGHEGFTVDASLMYRERSGDSTFVSIGPSISYASEDYMDAYFGVNGAQSAASGLSRFDADGGFKDIGFSANVLHMLDRHWFLNGMASYDLLIGDAADSPVTESESQPRFILGGGYRF